MHDEDGWWLCRKHARPVPAEQPRPNRTTLAMQQTRVAVAALHADGLDDAAIARRLGYTARTICNYRRELGLPRIPPPGPRCGTRWGYQQHLAQSEQVCAECRAAQRAYDRERKRRQRAEARQRERVT